MLKFESARKIIIGSLIIFTLIILFFIFKPKYLILQGEVVIRQISVAPKVTGRIEEVFVTEGDFVKQGTVLAKIDSPEIMAKSEQALAASRMAEAQYKKAQTGTREEDKTAAYSLWQKALVAEDLAKKTYDRVNELYLGGVVSAQKNDEAQAQYNAAKSDTEAAKARYDMAITGTRVEDKTAARAAKDQSLGAVAEIKSYVGETTLVAPIDGEISGVVVERGELVSAGFAVITMLNLDDVWLTFNMREDLLKNIKMDQVIEARIPALGSHKYKFKVSYISKMGDFAVWSATKTSGDFDLKTFEVRLRPDEKIEGLRQGMTALFKVRK